MLTTIKLKARFNNNNWKKKNLQKLLLLAQTKLKKSQIQFKTWELKKIAENQVSW